MTTEEIIKQKTLEIAGSLPKAASPFHVACIFEKKHLISIGQNSYETHPKVLMLGRRFNIDEYKQWFFLHAETAAIINCWGKIHLGKKHTICVVRLNKKNQLMLSRPCSKCMPIIQILGLRLIYSINGGFSNYVEI